VHRFTDDEKMLLASLASHPGFPVARSIFEAERDRYFANLARLLQRGEPIDQRVIDEKRGFWLGARWILAEAERGKAAFDKEQEELRERA
jgi:hypothetical protein